MLSFAFRTSPCSCHMQYCLLFEIRGGTSYFMQSFDLFLYLNWDYSCSFTYAITSWYLLNRLLFHVICVFIFCNKDWHLKKFEPPPKYLNDLLKEFLLSLKNELFKMKFTYWQFVNKTKPNSSMKLLDRKGVTPCSSCARCSQYIGCHNKLIPGKSHRNK